MMKKIITILICVCFNTQINAQTDLDGLMMNKNFFCAGATYTTAKWSNYWEGTTKRTNDNLGKVSNNSLMIMGNYGIKDNLNIIFGLPYIKTKASAGQLAGQQGLQDIMLNAKWIPMAKRIKGGKLQTILVVGGTVPVSNYTPDLLPLSIGLQSKTAMLRLMADYQKKNLFGTVSGSYHYRGNVKLDRDSYYTTTMHYTNMVAMPDAVQVNARAGYRSETWIVEAFANIWNSLNGHDITRNNMPFVSNRMNATTLGLHVKYDTPFVNGLSLLVDGTTTIAGRNMGQSNGISIGAFYIMDFSKKESKTN